MPCLRIDHATVIASEALLVDHTVLVESGRIASLQPTASVDTPSSAITIDAAGAYLAPGFLDLHIHGTHTFRVDSGPDDLAHLCQVLPRYGVTGFLPTVTPRALPVEVALLNSLAQIQVDAGAQILGFHLEGPYLALTGALPPELDHTPQRDSVRALIDAAKPFKAVFSISPEVEGILDVIPRMARDGTPVFITHTHASVAQTQAAIAAGARHATHFYDVYPIPAETDPGVRPCGTVEAILADPRVSVDFILDGEHVDPVAVQVALACKAPDRVCLITDANVGAGLPPGRHRFGNRDVVFAYPGGPARLGEGCDKVGALAGSGLSMDRALRNAVTMLGLDLPQAVRLVSTNPAAVLGLTDSKGRIQAGFDADLVLLDSDLRVCRTWVCGKECFSAA